MNPEINNKYQILRGYENIDRKQWAAFVEGHPNGTIFQTPEYYEIHDKVPGFLPYVLAICDDSEQLTGIMVVIINQVYGGIIGHFTARAIIAGGPLVKDNDEEITRFILQEYLADKKVRVIYSQFRNLFELGSMKNAFEAIGAKHEDHLNILIDLTQSEDDLWKGVKSRKRNNIRQAQRKGLLVRRLTTKKEADAAYPILQEVYKRAKLPLADKSLFMNAFNQMYSNGMLRIYGTFFQNELAGIMYIFSYNGRFYDWYAGSLKQYYQFNPNDILPWKIFKIAQSEKIPLFDFGGAGKPDIPYGVRNYKIQFGGELVNYGRYELPHNRITFFIMRIAFKAWQFLH
ncbi:MAG: peptidoglycan bridge formation glycyltransferase FemA/FemB family protein [Bacteroidota bacterium]|nr:peptidoglycan bridge formation glycyltransferase FemA/FemB family protein [Bacteroidota bacterium]